MIYTVATKKGIGVELWGDYDDLRAPHEVIGKFWDVEAFQEKKGFNNRDSLISGFSYEIRHAFQSDRLKRQTSVFSSEPIEYWGVKISWVHMLFSLAALKYNMRFFESNKFDLSVFLQLEFWLEKSMNDFDTEGAIKLLPFIDDAIYAANEYLYQYMLSINAEYFSLGGGKKAFRQLPTLLNRSVYGTTEYNAYLRFLTKEAERLKCEVSDLEISDDNIDYEIKW
jgi:hypothetical protein